MKAGDLVKFRFAGHDGHIDLEVGFIVHDLKDHVIVLWSKLWDESTERKSSLEVVSEG